MRWIIFIVIVFAACTSCSGSKQKIFESKQELVVLTAAQLEWSDSIFLKPYLDSLKFLKEGGDFPKFLNEDCFDYTHKFYWRPKHNPASFRKGLIFSVDDPEILLLLLKSSDRISDNICAKRLEHPYGGDPSVIKSQQLTTLQLVKNRFKELADK